MGMMMVWALTTTVTSTYPSNYFTPNKTTSNKQTKMKSTILLFMAVIAVATSAPTCNNVSLILTAAKFRRISPRDHGKFCD